jgi:hypothetical protein
MIPFIDGDKFSKMRLGSIERGIEAAKQIAEAHFGKPVEVLATHADHFFVIIEGDSSITRANVKIVDGEAKIVSSASNEGFVTEQNIEKYVSGVISESVDAILDGKPCNRLHVLPMLMKRGGRYLFSEEYESAMAVAGGDSYWQSLYELNKKSIRRSVYGHVREEEASVPKTRYGMIGSGKISEFEPELRESLAILFGIIQSVQEDLAKVSPDRVKADGWNVNKLLESIASECTLLADHSRKALELSNKNNLSQLASLHDRLADTVKSMTIMKRFVQTSTIEE